MLDQQLSQQMSSKGISVADMMLKQLMNNAHVTARQAASCSANAGNIAAMNRRWRRRMRTRLRRRAARMPRRLPRAVATRRTTRSRRPCEATARKGGKVNAYSCDRTRQSRRRPRARRRGTGALHHRPGGARGRAGASARSKHPDGSPSRNITSASRRRGMVQQDGQRGVTTEYRGEPAEEGRRAVPGVRFVRGRADRLDASVLKNGSGATHGGRSVARCRTGFAHKACRRPRATPPIRSTREKLIIDHGDKDCLIGHNRCVVRSMFACCSAGVLGNQARGFGREEQGKRRGLVAEEDGRSARVVPGSDRACYARRLRAASGRPARRAHLRESARAASVVADGSLDGRFEAAGRR